jgi:hypothetical protein
MQNMQNMQNMHNSQIIRKQYAQNTQKYVNSLFCIRPPLLYEHPLSRIANTQNTQKNTQNTNTPHFYT